VSAESLAASRLREALIALHSGACMRPPIERGPQEDILAKMVLIAMIERDLQTGLLLGSVPVVPGAHTQGETVEEVLRASSSQRRPWRIAALRSNS
jgi:hypothetical protein